MIESMASTDPVRALPLAKHHAAGEALDLARRTGVAESTPDDAQVPVENHQQLVICALEFPGAKVIDVQVRSRSARAVLRSKVGA